ncbi:MAG: MMPL family transporter [Oscillospiraceae bacterium]|jgi:predicted RND superfamily exporter protein|nr:MMPL family transporter [Oscillospiraceae bacterium]
MRPGPSPGREMEGVGGTAAFSRWSLRHRRLVVTVFTVAALVGAALSFGVTVNNNLVDYLPESAPSTLALKAMDAAFTTASENARVMAADISLSDALAFKRELAAVDGVASVAWLDDLVDTSVPIEMADQAVAESYYKDGNALYSLEIEGGREAEAVDGVRAILRPGDALAGHAVDAARIQRLASIETRNAMLILLPLILLVLVISTGAWLEPLLYLAVIGASVLINMGTNIFFKDVSFITQTVSPILQMAVSLDYAVFLLHRFKANRERGVSPFEAMGEAMTFSFGAISASAATTFFGFLALMFMKFGIGADLGLNLVKGIALSFLAVVVLLPSLTLCCLPMLDKTRHRSLLPNFARSKVNVKNGHKTYGVGSALFKTRWVALAAVLLVVAPAYIAQSANTFVYGMSAVSDDDAHMDEAARIKDVFGSSQPLVALVPSGDPGREALLSDALAAVPRVTGVVSYATRVGTAIPPEMVPPDALVMFQSGGWSRIIIYAQAEEESPEAFQLVEDIRAAADALYPGKALVTGQHASMYDMREVVTKDQSVVNYVAIGAIILVLLLTFRSVSLPLLLTLTIQTATWINLSVPYFTSSPLCYLGYLVVSTVQLGATVDYAILFTDHYMKNRKRRGRRDAIARSTSKTFGSIMVSGLILSGAGVALSMTSTNEIVRQMGVLLARGTALSILLVVFFLPAACAALDGVIRRTTIGAGFLNKLAKPMPEAETDADTDTETEGSVSE